MYGIEAADFVTIGLLVVLEAALSADNALVLAILVLPLPREQQTRALRYGILGAFVFRILATLGAVHLIASAWVKLLGGLYLLYLPYKHFTEKPAPGDKPKLGGSILGLSVFWSTVVRVELTDIVFAIDSILVAVAMSRKVWVVIAGGLLGIIAMRMLIGQLLGIVRRYPAIVDGAYVIVAWVGVKLVIEYAHAMHWTTFEIPRTISIVVVLALFAASAVYAVRKERKSARKSAAERVFESAAKPDDEGAR